MSTQPNPDILLAAAHRLVSEDRLEAELGILAIVGLAGLESSPKTAGELRVFVRKQTGIDQEESVVRDAMEVLRRAALAEPAHGERWTATAAGRQQVQQGIAWSARAREELERDVVEAVKDYELSDARQRAVAITDVLLTVLKDGLFTSIVTHAKGVDRIGPHLVPRSIDAREMKETAWRLGGDDDETVKALMAELLRRALSATELFAAVQVTDLVTAALMHLVGGRHDDSQLREAVGSLRGIVLPIDTPIALTLVDSPAVAANTERLLRQAEQCGIDLRYTPALKAELRAAFDNADKTLRNRVDDRFIMDELGDVLDLVDRDGLLSSYARGRLDGRYDSWEHFGREIDGVVARLGKLKVTMLNVPAESHPRTEAFLAEHNETIRRRGIKEPGTRGARADAQLMAYLERTRQKSTGKLWPAAWLLSPDTHVPETFRRLTGDTAPATVTLGQLGAILIRFADRTVKVDVAKAASASFMRDALLSSAARTPASVVDRMLDLASTPNVSAETRKKLAQGVAGVLVTAEEQTNVDAAISKMAAEVLTGTGASVQGRYELLATNVSARMADVEDELATAQSDTANERTRRVEAEAAKKAATDKLAVADEERRRESARRRRDTASVTAGALVVIVAILMGRWVFVTVGIAVVWGVWDTWTTQIETGQARLRLTPALVTALSVAADVLGITR